MPTVPQRQWDPNIGSGPPPSDGALLLETGSDILLESGAPVLLET